MLVSATAHRMEREGTREAALASSSSETREVDERTRSVKGISERNNEKEPMSLNDDKRRE